MFLYRKILSPGLWLQHFQPMSQLYIILYMVGCVNHFSSKFRLNFAEKPIFYRGFGMVLFIVPRYTISATTAAANSVIQNAFQTAPPPNRCSSISIRVLRYCSVKPVAQLLLVPRIMALQWPNFRRLKSRIRLSAPAEPLRHKSR